MRPVRMAVLLGMLLALGVVSLSAQPVISAKSGVLAYVEGRVFLGDQPVEYSVTKFPEMKENAVLRTEDGRAEVLLTPGVLLRLGENSSLKLITNRLIDTRLELLAGSASVEADAIGKDNSVTIVCKNGAVGLSKAGIYRFDANPGSLKVFKGEASVKVGDDTTLVSGGRMAMLSGTSAAVEKFNIDDTDALDHWSHRRGEYNAMANVSAAKSLMDMGGYSAYAPYLSVGAPNALGPYGMSPYGMGAYGMGGYGMGGYGMGGYGLNGCMNAWAFNQWYGMYTFMPCNGFMYSPYGYALWSPYSVGRAFYNGGGGYYGANRYGYGRGGAVAGAGASGYRGAARMAPGYASVFSNRGSGGFAGSGARSGFGGMSAAGVRGGGGGFGGSGGGGFGASGGGGVSSGGGGGAGAHGGGGGGSGGHGGR